MGEQGANRQLGRARDRLDKLPGRAVEQGWETSDPLLNETLAIIAHALIAQGEISQESLREMKILSHKIGAVETNNNFRSVQRVAVPVREINDWAKTYAKQAVREEVEKQMKKESGIWKNLMRFIFGGTND